ncbi:hypothetical protein BDF14DRAFT_1261005 [Spinellus fusiger]|nr:hypothetical protein BDF14DRAFT_1261005 [Spinellus fusiger]
MDVFMWINNYSRGGLHPSVVRAIRDCKNIKKVIFISCDSSQAVPNFIGLCRPNSNRYSYLPFKPTRAVSVDLFPHTEHCEFMVEFVREIQKEKVKKEKVKEEEVKEEEVKEEEVKEEEVREEEVKEEEVKKE